MEINVLAKMVHKTAKEHGFWPRCFFRFWRYKRTLPESLVLIHSEVSEALEAYRNRDDEHILEEIADIIIRSLDTVEAHKLGDIEEAILIKANKNNHRPYRHGNKRL